MELRSRCVAILKEALQEKNGVVVADLLAHRKITKRVLAYDMAAINEWLGAKGLGQLELSGNLLLLKTDSPAEISKHLQGLEAYQFSAPERQALEILTIALQSGAVTAQYFQELFDVSHNTAAGDLKHCRETVREYNLELVSYKRGYLLQGEEIAIRKLLGQQMYKLENDYPKSILQGLIQRSLTQLVGRDVDFWTLVEQGVEEYERGINTYLVLSDIDYEIAMILMACIRSIQGYSYMVDDKEKDALDNTPEYQGVRHILARLTGAGITLSEDETYYITILLLGIKNFDFHSTAEENSYITQISGDLIRNFERVACVTFEDKETFHSRLHLHIRPMYYRLKYGIQVDNALADQVQEMYSDIYEYTRRSIKLTGGELSNLVTDTELAFLSIYMASYLNKEALQAPQKQSRILVVCGAGVATSVLLREQLTELLGNAFQYFLVPARTVEMENLAEYSLIVSTVPIKGDWSHVIQTGPILSDNAKSKIVDAIAQMPQYSAMLREMDEVLDVIRDSATINNLGKLQMDLLRFYLKRGKGAIPALPQDLASMVRSGSTVRISSADTRPGAIEESAGMLAASLPLGSQERREAFRGEAIRRLMPPNLSVEISPGVVLRHCYGGDICEQVGVSIQMLEKSMLSYRHHPMRIMVTLSTVDNFSHYPLLNELYKTFENEELCSRLITAIADGEYAVSGMLADYLEHARKERKV